MKLGSRTHICDGARGESDQALGRIVNLYVHQGGKWVKVGRICSNCGVHWVDGKACSGSRSRDTKTA